MGSAEPAGHDGDRKDGLSRFYELEGLDSTAPVSRSNQAAAREDVALHSQLLGLAAKADQSSRSAALRPWPTAADVSSRLPSGRSACASQSGMA